MRSTKESGRGQGAEEAGTGFQSAAGAPKHIAIIMDGNGRWAALRGLTRAAGHRAGVESLREAVKTCSECGVQVLTVYAFSTENWKRPKGEVNALMRLLGEYLQREIPELRARNVRLRVMGGVERLPPSARRALQNAVESTKDSRGLVLNLALNYGGRWEIVEAARTIAREVGSGRLAPEDIDEGVFAAHLQTAGLPELDLLIRPSGEQRLSNFLLWQVAYSELWITPVLWPDFRRDHLLDAIGAYQRRERRFGGAGGRMNN